MLEIVFISTGLTTPELQAACKRSVADQVIPPGVSVRHWYHDAHKVMADTELYHPLVAKYGLIQEAIDRCGLDAVIAELDGDDMLLPGAVQAVTDAYAEPGMMLTYGSFRLQDGRDSYLGWYPQNARVREWPWKASHLKTYRARLAAHLRPERDFMRAGSWRWAGRDLAVMFPIIELAGLDRCRHIAKAIYCYNLAASDEIRASHAEKKSHARDVAEIRALKPLNRLTDAQLYGTKL